MKKIIYIILCGLFICTVFSGCRSGDDSGSNENIFLHETPQTYVLLGEETDEFTLMPTVTIYENGNARLSQPPISSMALVGMGRYEINGDELTVSHGGGASATFTISDNGNTLTLKSATIGFTKIGSVYKFRSNDDHLKNYYKVEGEKLTLDILRELGKKPQSISLSDFDKYEHYVPIEDPDICLLYVDGEYSVKIVYTADGNTSCTVERLSSGEMFPLELNGSTGLDFDEFLGIISISKYEPRKWVDYFRGDAMLWDESKELTLPEFPGVTFTWTPYAVTANGKELFSGMPVWNVFLADLTNDGKPELCATVSFGSGMIDERIIVYDYAEDKTYTLEDRGKNNYHLSIDDGQLLIGEGKLLVTRTDYSDSFDGVSGVTAELWLVNGAIFSP